jgi:tripartite-type tricarboxylate transporter receptor subunit TctC
MTSAGGGAHIAGEMFTAMAGVNIVRIPYKSSSQQNVDLLSGQVQMTFNDPGSLAAQVKAGKLKALGVGSLQPSALAPGLPTIASTLPGFETAQYIGVLAPANVPAAIINRLSQEFARIVNSPEVKEKLFNGGFEAIGNTPQQFAAIIKADMASTGKIVKDANIRAD